MIRKLTSKEKELLSSCIDPATHFYLQQHTTETSRSLEIGCGPGQYRLSVRGDYLGVDLSAAEYNEDLPRTPDVLADGMLLPFGNEQFDVVFYSNVFYHFGDGARNLAEVHRILKENGKVLIFDYSQKTLIRVRKLYAQSCPEWTVFIKNCEAWVALVEGAGFQEVALTGKSLSIKQRLLRLMKWKWLRPIYFFIIDRFEGSIFVMGRKPFSSAGGQE